MILSYPFDPNSKLYRSFRRRLRLRSPAAALAWDIALQTGLRVSDVVRLHDLPGRQWIQREQKTGKYRCVEVSPALWRRMAAGRSGYLFPGRSEGRHLHRDTIGHAIKRTARELRLPPGCGMHSARKMYAVALYRSTRDLESVRRALGHEKLDTTLRYVFLAAEIGDEYTRAASAAVQKRRHYDKSRTRKGNARA